MLLKQHFVLININFIIFMLLGMSLSNEQSEKVYPRIIRKHRTKRESNLAQNLEVN